MGFDLRMLLGMIGLLFLAGAAQAGDLPAPGMMSTDAGVGERGYSGDGGPALKAKLSEPFHCDVDHDGNLYIAEAANHCVRKVERKSGIISTVAGTGKKGYSGDGGKATEATFHEPYAVVVTRDRDLFIVDRLNAVVRRVDGRTGIVSTVAGNGKQGYSGDGGKATEAMLREPNDCCLDGKGGLLIADVGDWRIRRLDLTTGIISTFAGTGKAKIPLKTRIDRSQCGDGGPAARALVVGARAVCVDGKGNTYLCEREGSAIRKVDARGNISTVAGTGEWGYAGDRGDAKQAVFAGPKGLRCDRDGNLYVVDCENHAIRKIDAQTQVVNTIAGGRKGAQGDGGPALQAGLDRPHGCIVDAQGSLFIADTNNHRVRRVQLAP
jgi:DNA-binding beta-propeller fold protein YncE